MAKKGRWESMYRNCEWQLSKFPVLSSLAWRKSQAVSGSSSWRRKKTGRTKWNLRPYVFWKNGLWPDMRGLGEEWNESWLQYTETVKKKWRPKGKGKKSLFCHKNKWGRKTVKNLTSGFLAVLNVLMEFSLRYVHVSVTTLQCSCLWVSEGKKTKKCGARQI